MIEICYLLKFQQWLIKKTQNVQTESILESIFIDENGQPNYEIINFMQRPLAMH